MAVATFFVARTSLAQSATKQEPLEMLIDVKARVTQIKDSLLKSGTDTLFVFEKSCKDCYFVPVTGNEKKEKQGAHYSMAAYAQPAYIFWISKGSFYVKKVDAFAEYCTVKRQDFYQYPLYDYFLKNKDSILLQEYPKGHTETKSNGEGITSTTKTHVAYYTPKETFVPEGQSFSNTVTIQFNAGKLSVSKTVSENDFNPIATEKEELELKKQLRSYYSDDPVIIGNTKANYMMNRYMNVFIWKTMVESELFEIEMAKLWAPVPGKKK